MRVSTCFAVAALLTAGCTAGSLDANHTSSNQEPVLRCHDETDDEYCMLDDLEDEERRELRRGGCWITGGGHLGSEEATGGAGQHDQDSFGFNAMGMKDGRVRGELQNTTHLGDVFHGHATWIVCWQDDGAGPQVPKAVPNNAMWGGHGVWNHEEGYTWRAHLADRAEGGSQRDEYELWVHGPDDDLVYSQTAEDDRVIAGGNFQIHPPNKGHPYLEGDVPDDVDLSAMPSP